MIPFEFKSEHPKTWFFDLDGTLVEYNLIFTENCDRLLPGAKDLIDSLPPEDYIVITTARPEAYRAVTLAFLKENNIRYDHAIFGIPRGERIIVNDDKPNGDPACMAWRVQRNKGFPQ